MLPKTVDLIRAVYRQYRYVMLQRLRNDAALLAHIRQSLGWRMPTPEELKIPKVRIALAAERKRIEKHAKVLVALGEREVKTADALGEGKKPPRFKALAGNGERYEEFADTIRAAILARKPFQVLEDRAVKEMDDLGRQLPVWPWFRDNVFKKTAKSLAVIVGEAGDLGNYSTHSKLWKRMCLAVMDGNRQGNPGKGASKEEWIAHGYKKDRRAQMWVIGAALEKSRGRYKAVYLARKQYKRDKAIAAGLTVCAAAAIPKKRADEFMSIGHIRADAQRYMEKRLLRDLWRAWRKAETSLPDRANENLPSAEDTAATAARDGEGGQLEPAATAAMHRVPTSPTDTQAGQRAIAADRGQTKSAGLGSPIAGHFASASSEARGHLPATPSAGHAGLVSTEAQLRVLAEPHPRRRRAA